ncbi:hypothetical protein BDZ97DRAFT_522906 [Flammula alnicola]|nr:hypothetical protein BDZ97DRAFT_522906 [Flammula alnicola]
MADQETKTGSISVHEQFNPSDADVTFQSSDGVTFNLHRKNLEAHTGAFPGAEFDTRGEITHLTEEARVLEIVFDFVYPRRHSDLEDKDFDTVAAVAEAVEKYEVFSAMYTCQGRLGNFLPHHAAEILGYAIKHHHPKLVDQAVSYLARSPLVEVQEKLPYNTVLPWSRYYTAWRTIFEKAMQHIDGIPINPICNTHGVTCVPCRCSLITWVAELEQINTLPGLKRQLKFT